MGRRGPTPAMHLTVPTHHQSGLPSGPSRQSPEKGTYAEHVENHRPLSSILVGEDVIGEFVQG